VVLPLATRIVNNVYQARLGCRPADLVTVAPSCGVRGLLDPIRPLTEQLPLSTEFVTELHRAHESMLDAASTRLLAEQRRLEQDNGPAAAVKPLSPGDLVLLHYPVRPPSKLHSRVAGPFRVIERRGNLIYARDLTCERVIERDAEMWTPFHVPRSMSESELRKIAAAILAKPTWRQLSITEVKPPSPKSSLKFYGATESILGNRGRRYANWLLSTPT